MLHLYCLLPPPCLTVRQQGVVGRFWCERCGLAPWDDYGFHFWSCRHRPCTRMHTALLRRFWFPMVQSAFETLDCHMEDDRYLQYSPDQRPDITVYGYRPSAVPGRSSHLLLDASCVGSCTPSATGSSCYASRLQSAERTVAQDYRRVAPHRFFPLVTDSFGAMAPAARRFFSECCERRAHRLRRSERDLSTFTSRSYDTYYQQLHAVTFWRIAADAFIRHCADRQRQPG